MDIDNKFMLAIYLNLWKNEQFGDNYNFLYSIFVYLDMLI